MLARHPLQRALLRGSGERPVYPRRIFESIHPYRLRPKFVPMLLSFFFVRFSSFPIESYFLLRSASHVDCNVNSSDSRGTLSTKGLIAHPSPVGMDRVSDTDSICM